MAAAVKPIVAKWLYNKLSVAAKQAIKKEARRITRRASSGLKESFTKAFRPKFYYNKKSYQAFKKEYGRQWPTNKKYE